MLDLTEFVVVDPVSDESNQRSPRTFNANSQSTTTFKRKESRSRTDGMILHRTILVMTYTQLAMRKQSHQSRYL